MCTYSVCSEFLFCVADQVYCINGTNPKKKTTEKPKQQQQNKTTPPPPKKKNKKKTTKKNNNKKQQKNSNKQITKTDKTQQTNVALATASRGFALIRLFFGGGFACSALFYGICVQWLFSENLKIQNVVCDTTF